MTTDIQKGIQPLSWFKGRPSTFSNMRIQALTVKNFGT